MSTSWSCKYRKKTGLLQLFGNKLKFVPDGFDSPTLELTIDAIKSQAVNPATSDKAMLKITIALPSGEESTCTFNFAQAAADRDELKHLLQSEISKSKASTPAAGPGSLATDLSGKEIRARKLVLAKDRRLAALHKELVVVTQVITEREFWESRRFLLEREMWKNDQKKGLPSSSLSDLKATAINSSDSSGDMKLTLTPVQIHQIFLEYPSVKRAYQDNVPVKMDEQKFWSNFVVSKYFHRSRGTLGVSSALEAGNAFFKKYEKDDEMDGAVRNIMHDLNSTLVDHPATGNNPDVTMQPGRQEASMPLIRRYNRHAQALLQGVKLYEYALSNVTYSEGFKDSKERDVEYKSQVELNDLSEAGSLTTIPLTISDPRQYFGGDVVHSNVSIKRKPFSSAKSRLSEISLDSLQRDDLLVHLNSKKRKLDQQRDNLNSINQESEEFRQAADVYAAGSELLRHFWSIFVELDTDAKVAKCRDILSHLTRVEDGISQIRVLDYRELLSKLSGSIGRARKYLESFS
ncbi:MAG: hypothetical protein SGCHY_003049 [Lobulomycetales sp.]